MVRVIAVLQQISTKWLLFLKHLFRSGSSLSPASPCLIALWKLFRSNTNTYIYNVVVPCTQD